MKNKLNEKGLTLIELLVVIVMTSIVAVFVTAIVVTTIRNYMNISNENTLRDEADLLLSQVYKKVYTVKESQICPRESDEYLTFVNDTSNKTTNCAIADKKQIIGFKDNNYYIGTTTPYTVQNNEIEVTSGAVYLDANATKGVYNIEVTLKMKKKSKSKNFVNKVRSITDN